MDIIIYFYTVCIIKMYMIYNLIFFAVCYSSIDLDTLVLCCHPLILPDFFFF